MLGHKRWLTVAVLGTTALLAGLFTLFDVQLASSQGAVIEIRRSLGPVPENDPDAAVWDAAPEVNVPLSAQHITVPGGGSVLSVRARALSDGTKVYFRLEWQDDTKDASTVDTDGFRDAAAIQLPLDPGNVPYYCMGQKDGGVNIWHWKADWNEAVLGRDPRDAKPFYGNYYPFEEEDASYAGRAADNPISEAQRSGAVESLIAGGFGTLTTAPKQNVTGTGAWRDGVWRVVFARELAGPEATEARLDGKTLAAAFAVWDGAKQERTGMKATSGWITIQNAAAAGQTALPPWGILLATGVGIVAVVAVGMRTLPS